MTLRDSLKQGISIILSHHTKDRYESLFRFKIKKHEIFLCVRCSGMVLTCLIFYVFLRTFLFIDFLLAYILQTIFVGIAVFEWSTYKMLLRYSKREMKFIAGLFLGVGISLSHVTKQILMYHIVLVLIYTCVCIISFVIGRIKQKNFFNKSDNCNE